MYSLCTSLALRHTVQSTSMSLSTLWLSNKLLKKLSIKRHSFASSSSGASWVETNSKPKCGGVLALLIFFLLVFFTKAWKTTDYYSCCETILYVVKPFRSSTSSSSSFQEVVSAGLLPAGSRFVFAHSHQLPHGRSWHAPLLKFILLTWTIPSIYQAFRSYLS